MTQLRLAPAPLPTDPSEALGPGAQVTHLLALSDYLDPSDIEFLLQCRESRAAWETLPQELVDGDIVEVVPGTIRLTPHAVVHGPYSPLVLAPDNSDELVSLETGAVQIVGGGLTLDTGVLHLDQNALMNDPQTMAHPAKFPASATMIWALTCVRERGEAPFLGGGDKDGLARAFSNGMPIREELRQVTNLVAIARFLEGSVHFDAGELQPVRHYRPELDSARYRTVAPDPAANVDLTVYSDVWLDPQAALRLAQVVVPTMQYMPTEVPWDGPSMQGLPVESPLDSDMIEYLHSVSDAFDEEALTADDGPQAYGLVYEGSKGDLTALEVAGTADLPPILENIEWAKNGVIEYRITWVPSDLEDWQKEIPSFELRQRRTPAAAVVRSLARAVYSATAGEVVDQDGFLKDPAAL